MAGPTADFRTQQIESELKVLIVESLRLEGVQAHDIDREAALVGGGLGLDSIDVLELAMAINKRYGVKIEAEDATEREIFKSVRALAAFIVDETSRLLTRGEGAAT